jgi:hypothetical protein
MRLPRMTPRRWMIAVGAVAVLAWSFRWAGFMALAWGAHLLGSSLGILLATEKERRLAGSVLGGAVTGACFWFVNFFFLSCGCCTSGAWTRSAGCTGSLHCAGSSLDGDVGICQYT